MQVNYSCLQHTEGDVTASDSTMASYVAHDPEVSLPFGLSSTGKIWSWLILAVFIHVISDQQFGSLAGLPGL